MIGFSLFHFLKLGSKIVSVAGARVQEAEADDHKLKDSLSY